MNRSENLRRYKLKLLLLGALLYGASVALVVTESLFSYDPMYLYSIKVPGDFDTLNEALEVVPEGGSIWIGSASAVEYPIIVPQDNITLYCGENVTLRIPKGVAFLIYESQTVPKRYCDEISENPPFKLIMRINVAKNEENGQ